MKGFRVSILDVMTLVVIAAVDCAIVKASIAAKITVGASTNSPMDLTAFVLGVLPLANLLIFLALVLIPRRMRSKTPSSFLAGFQFFGWIAILLFVALSAIRPSWIIDYGMAVSSIIPIGAMPQWESVPMWLAASIEFGFIIIIFTTPELIIALFGGWLTRKLGITVLIERQRGEPRAVSVAEEKEAAKTLANTPG